MPGGLNAMMVYEKYDTWQVQPGKVFSVLDSRFNLFIIFFSGCFLMKMQDDVSVDDDVQRKCTRSPVNEVGRT